ncbi:MAG TPA: serine hydrolase [Streptosporangiaceae bacterium]|nr:serine hydrolase [Streptosporangiaceae bacterium]
MFGTDAGQAGARRRARLDDLYALQVPAEPALAPDGSRVIYVLRTTDREADADRRVLWEVSTGGGAPRQLTRGTADTAPAWSPDGSQIAFLRGGPGPAQLWLLPAAAGEPEQLTRLPLGAGRPAWSPDCTRIAFAAPAGPAAVPGMDDAARERLGQAPAVIDRLDFKADGAGLHGAARRHLHIVDVPTGQVRQVTSGDWHAGDPAWSPDGTQLAFSAAAEPDSDLTGSSAVYVVSAGDAAARPRLAGLAGGIAGPVTWTPDGAAVLVVGATTVRAGHAGLWRVPLDGSPVSDLTAGLDRNVMPGGPAYPGGLPAVSSDGATVLLCVRDRGCTGLYAVDAGGGTVRPVLAGGDRVVSGLSLAHDAGLAAVIVSDPASFGEVAVVEALPPPAGGATVRVLTGHTRAALPDVELLAAAEREFVISDGTRVHGWLLRDPQASAPGPLLLDIHGGPHNAWHPAADAAHLYHQVLADRGFAVLTLNPRGSDGYGESFYTAALGAWGTADEHDLLEPVQALIAEGIAEPGRLAVAGYSYGGFMTCHLTTRTSQFAAAVAGGLVSDLASMAGTSDAGHHLSSVEFGVAARDGRGAVRALSPIEHVGQVSTPTLMLHGAADDRCPPGQAEQWFTALREREVPARLVLYPGASHLFILDGLPSQRADYGRRLAGWVADHAGAGQARPRGAAAALDRQHWQARLAELAARHQVPGATLGILRMRPGTDDEVALAAHGVLSKSTEVPVTTDSLFQIGSISKVWTTTLLMQLAEEGRADLDAPLSKALPGLVLPGELAERATIRHLVTHTSGLDGDIFDDTGRGDDCVEKYVARLAGAGCTHPLGATFSYCNSGFVLAGRVVEVLTGKTWDAALAERLIRPLGLAGTCTLPEEALLHRAATGHIGEPGKPEHVAPAWSLPRAVGPAGLICSTAADVLTFARLHLAGGQLPDSARLLAAGSVAAMQGKHADLPDSHTLGDSWGLGWMRFGWADHRLVGHDGGTIGQYAFLRILPSQGLAVTLLTNGGQARGLYQDLFREIFSDVAGVAMPSPLEPPARALAADPGRYTGTYERVGLRTEIGERAGELTLRSTVTGPLAALQDEPTHEVSLVPAGEDLFVMRRPGEATWTAVTYYLLPDGTPCLHYGGRANPRVG